MAPAPKETLFLAATIEPPYPIPAWSQPGILRVSNGSPVILKLKDGPSGPVRWYTLTETPVVP